MEPAAGFCISDEIFAGQIYPQNLRVARLIQSISLLCVVFVELIMVRTTFPVQFGGYGILIEVFRI